MAVNHKKTTVKMISVCTIRPHIRSLDERHKNAVGDVVPSGEINYAVAIYVVQTMTHCYCILSTLNSKSCLHSIRRYLVYSRGGGRF